MLSTDEPLSLGSTVLTTLIKQRLDAVGNGIPGVHDIDEAPDEGEVTKGVRYHPLVCGRTTQLGRLS